MNQNSWYLFSCAVRAGRRVRAILAERARRQANAPGAGFSMRTPSCSNRALHRGLDQVKPCDVLDWANSSSMIGGNGGFSAGFAVEQTLLKPPSKSVSLPATVSCRLTLSSIENAMQ